MPLQTKIETKLSEALKSKDKKTYSTLRLVVAAIKDTMIAKKIKDKKILPDNDLIGLLKKMVKQRNDSCDAYKKAGRNELLENEMSEIKIINEFLPKQLSEEETKKICFETMKKVGEYVIEMKVLGQKASMDKFGGVVVTEAKAVEDKFVKIGKTLEKLLGNSSSVNSGSIPALIGQIKLAEADMDDVKKAAMKLGFIEKIGKKRRQ